MDFGVKIVFRSVSVIRRAEWLSYSSRRVNGFIKHSLLVLFVLILLHCDELPRLRGLLVRTHFFYDEA